MERPKHIQRFTFNRREQVEPSFMGTTAFGIKEAEDSIERISADKDLYELERMSIKAKSFDGTEGEGVVFIYAKKTDMKEVKRLLNIYADETRNDHKLVSNAHFGTHIVKYSQSRICGWHCVDRDFIFFTNLKAMQVYLSQING